MAQLIIPAVALGGLYIISNHNKEEEDEETEGFANHKKKGSPSNTSSKSNSCKLSKDTKGFRI